MGAFFFHLSLILSGCLRQENILKGFVHFLVTFSNVLNIVGQLTPPKSTKLSVNAVLNLSYYFFLDGFCVSVQFLESIRTAVSGGLIFLH